MPPQPMSVHIGSAALSSQLILVANSASMVTTRNLRVAPCEEFGLVKGAREFATSITIVVKDTAALLLLTIDLGTRRLLFATVHLHAARLNFPGLGSRCCSLMFAPVRRCWCQNCRHGRSQCAFRSTRQRYGGIRYYHPLLKRAGLPKIRFHDLRHTAATLLLGRGSNPNVVSEIFAHAHICVMLGMYSHVISHMQQQADSAMTRRWMVA